MALKKYQDFHLPSIGSFSYEHNQFSRIINTGVCETLMPRRATFFRNDSFWKGMYIEWKGLITSTVHVKYESPSSNSSKIMAKVKVFRYVGQGHYVKTLSMNVKASSQGMCMWNKALPGTVQKLWLRLTFLDMWVKGHGQGHYVKTLSMNVKASSQGMCMWNKALPGTVQKLWLRLTFLDMWVKGHGQGHYVKTFGIDGKASLQGMYMWNMKALHQTGQKLWPR